MKVGILGSGRVGQTIGGKLANLGHEVMLGTRDPSKLQEWREKTGENASVGLLPEAASHGEILVNAVPGGASLAVLALAGEENLNGKVLIDLSNPLVMPKGAPPTLLVANIDSVAEQIQRAYPEVKVVKTLNTAAVSVLVNPGSLGNGDHDLFISGNDADAKALVSQLLKSWFGWKRVIDLGDITTARGAEMYMVLWVLLLRKFGSGQFNIKIVQ